MSNADPDTPAARIGGLEPPDEGPVRGESSDVDVAVAQLLGEVGAQPELSPLFQANGLRGRSAIVTGGSSGIGRAVAIELATCGVNVAFNYYAGDEPRAFEDAEQVVDELSALNVQVFCQQCDVRDSSAVDDFVRSALEAMGGLHILVNNAGIGRDRAMWHMSDDEWRSVIDTNLNGAFHTTRAVAPHMRSQEYGKIVNVSSVHGIRSDFGISNYAASKAGLIGLTQSTAIELGPKNINVNAVAPGFIRTTRLTEGVPADILDRARERSILGRLGDPRDVAVVVVFLCTEGARHITGAVIPVDAGHLL